MYKHRHVGPITALLDLPIKTLSVVELTPISPKSKVDEINKRPRESPSVLTDQFPQTISLSAVKPQILPEQVPGRRYLRNILRKPVLYRWPGARETI